MNGPKIAAGRSHRAMVPPAVRCTKIPVAPRPTRAPVTATLRTTRTIAVTGATSV